MCRRWRLQVRVDPGDDVLADLGYRSQQQGPRSPLVGAVDRVETAAAWLETGAPRPEEFREYYEALQAAVGAFNGFMGDLGDEYGDEPRWELSSLPSYEVWIDHRLHHLLGEGGRSYSRFGRCTAMAKTTGERCLQPASGEHGTCYYHGGAEGAGAPERNTNAAVD